MVLKEAFGLPDPLDPSAAMTLNGGVAYSGGVCGAISGASLAVGLLASRRFKSHVGPSEWPARSSPASWTTSGPSTARSTAGR